MPEPIVFDTSRVIAAFAHGSFRIASRARCRISGRFCAAAAFGPALDAFHDRARAPPVLADSYAAAFSRVGTTNPRRASIGYARLIEPPCRRAAAERCASARSRRRAHE
ncbi:hypothetical protein X997_6385 [Burkholderia pseudomallei A79C]|nr:hypothetical protein X997_6385 [Burkholderia pseudomallei A79C]